MKNEKGFTLVEMLVVLLVISILVMITVPNLSKHFSAIDRKGCDAYIQMVQAQVDAYKLENVVIPTIKELEDAKYIRKGGSCPNGNKIKIDTWTGEVTEVIPTTGSGTGT